MMLSRLRRAAVNVSPAISLIRPMSKMTGKAVTLDNLNPNLIKVEYAVRGPLVTRAGEIEKELEKGAKKPFSHVIRANIGDAHAMGQQPITYIRQVLACVANPALMASGTCGQAFPADVKQRAQEVLNGCGGKSIGSYTMSFGLEVVRRAVADYIERRDGHKADWQNMVLSNGASTAIKNCLQLLVNKVDGKPSGVMIPIPQYPLYSASLSEFGLAQVGYYLNEDKRWGLDVDELERALKAGSASSAVRAIVIINPGNPTGQVLTRANIEAIVKFSHKHRLFIFADEVYQDNVYDKDSAFFSFKKVMSEMGAPYNQMELVSFMSISKGYMGECGLRGGWMELCNLDPAVMQQLLKCISANLCPTTLGQTAVYCTARHPREGEPSYAQWLEEKTGVLQSLKHRAQLIYDAFNSMPGFSCNPVMGAMYAFPRFMLSEKALKAAKEAGVAADMFYARKLLESTGICIVPGSGFGQREGTHHFRTTILPQTAQLQEMLDIFKQFHAKFTEEYK